MVVEIEEGEVRNGVYKHFKSGDLYVVFGCVQNAEDNDSAGVVLYRRKPEGLGVPTPTFARSVESFSQMMHSAARDTVRRFEWVEPI